MDSDKAPKITTSKNKHLPLLYFTIFVAICLGIMYYIHEWNTSLKNILKNIESKPKIIEIVKKTPNLANNEANTAKNLHKKPIYFNYYDSIVFLNDVKGSKIVVSKGYDEYIKKNKIIVKSDGYYFNVFSKDLYNNYAVGDSIP